MADRELESLAAMIKTRNSLYVRFFKHHLPDRNIRYTGNPQAPIIIIDNKFMTNTYVKNFVIHFTDGKANGVVLHTYKLSSTHPDRLDDEENFRPWFENYPMKKCFCLTLKGSGLYVSGSQLDDDGSNDSKVRYPMFSAIKPSIFYTRKYAKGVVEEYRNANALVEGQELTIV